MLARSVLLFWKVLSFNGRENYQQCAASKCAEVRDSELQVPECEAFVTKVDLDECHEALRYTGIPGLLG